MKTTRVVGISSVHLLLEVSTAQITTGDAELLDVDRWVEKLDFGWLLWIPEGDLLTDRLVAMRDCGYSQAFVDLMLLCSKRGCRWLLVDHDSDETSEFPPSNGGNRRPPRSRWPH